MYGLLYVCYMLWFWRLFGCVRLPSVENRKNSVLLHSKVKFQKSIIHIRCKLTIKSALLLAIGTFYSFILFNILMLYCNLQASDCLLILFRSIRRVFASITFGSMAVGRSSTQLPDYTKAKLAASNIKKLLARESAIDPMSTDGETPVS